MIRLWHSWRCRRAVVPKRRLGGLLPITRLPDYDASYSMAGERGKLKTGEIGVNAARLEAMASEDQR